MDDTLVSKVEDHTLDTLLAELISGREVIDSSGQRFAALSRDSRALLEWFRKNKSVWPGQNRLDFVGQMIGALKAEPPVTPALSLPSSVQGYPRYRLARLRASRFGGLHDFGTVASSTDPLEIDFSPDSFRASIIYGRNGCGKSSLLSAVCWCLTGWFYRPQGVPANNANIVEYYSLESQGEDGSPIPAIKAIPIIPMPSAQVLLELSKSKAQVETWVEVELVDDNGVVHGPFRRTATLRNNRVTETLSKDLSLLHISPADFEVGTRLPAMLAHIRLDERNGLSEAVARLIDIQPLSDVAKHADASILKTKKESKLLESARLALRQQIRAQSEGVLQDLEHLNFQQLVEAPSDGQPAPTLAHIAKLRAAVESKRGAQLSRATMLLQSPINFDDPQTQVKFIAEVTLAADQLAAHTLSILEGAKTWDLLVQVTPEQLNEARGLLRGIIAEAVEIQQLYRDPAAARRIQLYAKVAAWMKEEDDRDTTKCPVCGVTLTHQADATTGLSVESHLTTCLSDSSGKLERTPQKWAEEKARLLRDRLPPSLLRRATAGHAHEYASSIVEAIAKSPKFAGTLSSLVPRLRSRLAEVIRQLPVPEEPPPVELPSLFDNLESDIVELIRLVANNIHSVAKIQATPLNRSAIEELLLGSDAPSNHTSELLRGTVGALKAVALESQPLTHIIDRLRHIEELFEQESSAASKATEFERLVAGLQSLILLKDLVGQQVAGLLSTLRERQRFWLDKIYTPARIEQPEIGKAQLNSQGNLTFEATHNGIGAAAHQVANASHLRATLVAFWLAYWEYQLRSRGGLRLMLLDDPQDFFDEENQQQFARAIADIIDADAQLVLATNKRLFVHDIDWKRAEARRLEIAWRPGPCSIQLITFRDEIEKRLRDFKSTKDDDNAGRLSDAVRVFAETRLISLFRYRRPNALGDKPTFMSAVDAIRTLHSGGTVPFNGNAVTRLLQHSGCTANSPLYDLMNDSHHSRRSSITAGRVDRYLGEIESFVKAVDAAWEHCESAKMLTEAELVKRRKKATVVPALPAALTPLPHAPVPLLSATAAADGNTVAEEAEASGEFSWSSIGSVAVYRILSSSLGLAAPRWCRVIVAVDDREVPTNSLVIAIREDVVLARRLSRVVGQSEIVLLHSENLDARARPPVQVELQEDCRLLPVIGVIWDFQPYAGRAKGEAISDPTFDLSALRVTVALPVKGESAEPLVLSGQTVLLGEEILWTDLSQHVDEAVNIEMDDGVQFLKVVSDIKVDKAGKLRVFNPLGGLGDPLVVGHTGGELAMGFGSVRRARRIRRMLAVLYESAAST